MKLILEVPDGQRTGAGSDPKDVVTMETVREQLASLLAPKRAPTIRNWRAIRNGSRSPLSRPMMASRVTRRIGTVSVEGIPGTVEVVLSNNGKGLLIEEYSPVRSAEQTERERKLSILRRTQGMWKERSDVPKDGLQYQIETRSEWD